MDGANRLAGIHRHQVDKAEGEFPTEVEVALKDGRRFETTVPWPSGSLARPFTRDELNDGDTRSVHDFLMRNARYKRRL